MKKISLILTLFFIICTSYKSLAIVHSPADSLLKDTVSLSTLSKGDKLAQSGKNCSMVAASANIVYAIILLIFGGGKISFSLFLIFGPLNLIFGILGLIFCLAATGKKDLTQSGRKNIKKGLLALLLGWAIRVIWILLFNY
ncbi:MAG: hypothetical protein JNL70_13780 [Saprospiraceae bacterium]|nr:hypothetical protein [Saprospiraceae bacterium]